MCQQNFNYVWTRMIQNIKYPAWKLIIIKILKMKTFFINVIEFQIPGYDVRIIWSIANEE